MDGVVVDSMRIHAQSWIRILADYGLTVSPMDILVREGMSGLESIEEIFNEKGVAFPGELILTEILQRKHELFEMETIELFPMVGELLECLHNRATGLALVTGSPMRTVTHVIPPAVLALFDAVVTAEELAKGKPHPEPYLRALAKLGARADEALVVENAPQGIRSAVAAGIRCFAIESTLPAAYLIGAERVFATHEDLARCICSECVRLTSRASVG